MKQQVVEYISLSRQELADLVQMIVQQVRSEDMLTTEQAASYINVSVSMMHKLTTERAIPCEKVGKSKRFKIRDLDAYRANRRRKSQIEINTKAINHTGNAVTR